jgi:hypothetical protein
MWGPFNCPKCHKLLRVRRIYAVRILRLVVITIALFYLLTRISDWFGQHIQVGFFITAGTIGVVDEYVMRLFPATIESAAPGGLIAS